MNNLRILKAFLVGMGSFLPLTQAKREKQNLWWSICLVVLTSTKLLPSMQSPIGACPFARDVLADLIITHSPGFNVMALLIHRGVFNHCFPKESCHDRMTEDRWTVSLIHVFYHNQPTASPWGFLAQIPTYHQLSSILWPQCHFFTADWIRPILSSMTTL